jgi:membrane protein
MRPSAHATVKENHRQLPPPDHSVNSLSRAGLSCYCMETSLLWRILGHFRRAVEKSLSHDVFTTAKAAAYSAILSLFPALLVLNTVLALTPATGTVTGEIRTILAQVLPWDTMDFVQSYFLDSRANSVGVLWSATSVAFFAAMGVLLSLMEGFRRAYRLPRNLWSFWRSRAIAAALIPICLAPMFFATAIIVFGHEIESWMIDNSDHELRFYVLVSWRMLRWAISVATVVAVMTVLYHFGMPRTHSWKCALPGAATATLTWFAATLIYGWYVTRFAVYMVVYGSLAAAIATLVWLYITSLSILIGAEFNAQIFPKDSLTRPRRRRSTREFVSSVFHEFR